MSNTQTSINVDNTISDQITQLDEPSFSLLVERFQKPLFSYLGKMGLSQAIAEEVAQETFIRAWQAREKFDPSRAAFITWLFTIARRLAINETQRAVHRYEHGFEYTDGQSNNPQLHEKQGDAEGEGILSKHEQTQLLTYALSTLSVDDRSLLALAYIEEFEFKAIADIENIPVGTVKSRLHRIRQALKITLNGGS